MREIADKSSDNVDESRTIMVILREDDRDAFTMLASMLGAVFLVHSLHLLRPPGYLALDFFQSPAITTPFLFQTKDQPLDESLQLNMALSSLQFFYQ